MAQALKARKPDSAVLLLLKQAGCTDADTAEVDTLLIDMLLKPEPERTVSTMPADLVVHVGFHMERASATRAEVRTRAIASAIKAGAVVLDEVDHSAIVDKVAERADTLDGDSDESDFEEDELSGPSRSGGTCH
jgi:hypothetical protein